MLPMFRTLSFAAAVACGVTPLLAQEPPVVAAVDAAPAPIIAYQGRLLREQGRHTASNSSGERERAEHREHGSPVECSVGTRGAARIRCANPS